jgi:hypothetical protein
MAMAARRLPTPAGPASSVAGGSVPRATARDSSAISRRWPTIREKVTDQDNAIGDWGSAICETLAIGEARMANGDLDS